MNRVVCTVRAAFGALALFLVVVQASVGATYYVATNGSDAADGTSWATAKQTIQAAIDLTASSDTVLVSNGVYATGGREVVGAMTNRVAITNAITVSSVNGPRVTTIRGAGPVGNAAVRCVYVGTNATLAGFTLTNGATRTAGETNGGGAWCESSGILSNCTLAGNSAGGSGGGSYQGTLVNCLLTRNSASNSGGGTFFSVLNNCTLASNSALYGGGSYGGTLNNCTLARNSATNSGGGSYEGTLNNCIVWSNSAPTDANYFLGSGSINHSGTTPDPGAGTGNITNDPQFVSLASTNLRLSATSPCINAGDNAFAPTNATPFDQAGSPRIINGTVDMGAFEAPPALTVAAIGGTTTGSGIYPVGSNVIISAIASNGHWYFTGWNDSDTSRTRTIVMPASNITYTATFTQYVGALTFYVRTTGSDAADGRSWPTAKQTIQAAVDSTLDGDTVLVSNGVYATGGRVAPGALASLTNRVAIIGAITVSSVNGPGVTSIRGVGPVGNAAVRCVYVGTNATLAGFTLTNGATRATGETNGGGAWCEASGVLINCVLTRNAAAGGGGGSYQGTLNNCVLASNAASFGGGSYQGALNNCTLADNAATNAGGGSYEGTLNNCIVWSNSAPTDANYFLGSGSFNYSCTAPDPGTGTGNITNDPQFVSSAATNLRLSATSPCRDAGSNTFAPTNMTPYDLAGSPRIINGTVDMGAFEAPPALTVVAIGGTATGSGIYAVGSNVVILATASNSHWFFTGWNDSDTNLTRTIVMPAANITYTATFTQYVGALTFYVRTTGSDAADGRSWPTAKQTIQAAVDVALDGDTVLVSNGVYATGGRVVAGAMTNRVAITNAITVSSVNGPGVTTIRGAWHPGTTNGNAAVRCVYVGTNATLAGFTLTNGATRATGDTLLEQSGGGAWCEASSVLSNCTLTRNSANNAGGGAYQGTLHNCTLTRNSANNDGGGSFFALLNNCTVTSNSAAGGGGGLYGGIVNNGVLAGNSAGNGGGGALAGTLNNCTLTGNSAGIAGGGSYDSMLNNCIVWSNSAPADANHFIGIGSVNHSCTAPLPTNGANNITNDPQFVSLAATNLRLTATSPCRDTGDNAYAPTNVTPFDLAGSPRIINGTVDMGAYEVPPALTVVAIGGTSTGGGIYPAGSNVVISATASNSHWFFTGWNDGDTNLTRMIVMPTSDLTYTATFTQVVGALTFYVATNGSDAADGRSWPTAKQTIQAAADVALDGDTVLVSNGVYATGGRVVAGAMTNRVAITNAITVSSVNGPSVTVIRGAKDPLTTNGNAAVRCVYVGTNATLAGFTLTNGATRTAGNFPTEQSGGGVWCATNAVVSNCTLSGNSAKSYGGAAAYAILTHCTLTGNSADSGGGGSYMGTLTHCALTGNSALSYGGGSYDSLLSNCTLTGNSAASSGGGSVGGILNACTLTGNSAGQLGGGAQQGTLNNCMLTGNSAGFGGGGAYQATLNNCTLTGNSAGSGGGSYYSVLNNCTLTRNSASGSGGGSFEGTLNNCIIWSNSASSPANYYIVFGAINYSCTTPLPSGPGNITNDPQFVSLAATNLRLSVTSPCINAGNNTYAPTNTAYDLGGGPRIVGAAVDMGAFEYQGATTGYWRWAASITNGLTNYNDSATGDGYANLLKYATGSSPTNPDDLSRITGAFTNGLFAARFNRNTNAGDVTLFVERSSDATNGSLWTALATNILGSWSGDTNVTETGPGTPVSVRVTDPDGATNKFFRLRVTLP